MKIYSTENNFDLLKPYEGTDLWIKISSYYSGWRDDDYIRVLKVLPGMVKCNHILSGLVNRVVNSYMYNYTLKSLDKELLLYDENFKVITPIEVLTTDELLSKITKAPGLLYFMGKDVWVRARDALKDNVFIKVLALNGDGETIKCKIVDVDYVDYAYIPWDDTFEAAMEQMERVQERDLSDFEEDIHAYSGFDVYTDEDLIDLITRNYTE